MIIEPTAPPFASRLPGVGVELVHWPREESLRRSLARSGVARLLLVAPEVDAPEDVGVDEDWIRMPADERDVAYRARRLSRWLAHVSNDHVVVDEQRMVHRGDRAVAVSAGEAALLGALLASPGTLSRNQLERAVWADGAPSPRALDNLIYRLRNHLERLGIAIVSARGRGFSVRVDAGTGP